jgi:hypothetical protein
MTRQKTKNGPSESPPAQSEQRDSTKIQQLISAHAISALRTLRRAMWDPRASPAARLRAAQFLLDLALRTAAIEDEKARLARLEEVNPRKAALERLTEDELRMLQDFIMDREEGNDLAPHQVAIARDFATLEQDIRATKLRRLSKKQPPTQR